MTAPNPLYLTEEQAREAQEAQARDLQARLTLELAQPLTNEHRRRRPRRIADVPLFERQETLSL
jgi:hypothetical protein